MSDRQTPPGQQPARLTEGGPGEARHGPPLPCVEGGVPLTGRPHGPFETPAGTVDVDECDALQFSGGGQHHHDLVTVVALPLLVRVVERHGNPVLVPFEGPQWISARALHGRKSVFVDQNRVSRLEQRIEGNGLSLFVVVIPHECVVTQENGGEPVEKLRYPIRAEIECRGPGPCRAAVARLGEIPLQPLHVTGLRLPGSAVQAGRVPLLQPAVGRPRPHVGVPSEAAALREERRE
ncbi:hypothetical protein GCM10010451_66810 [Streptomyces virens]|uniref:Uncharacterized protein n=1 Tax=Streptomyces virens TaxID=285572 RepID=A0ABN3UZ21_9ACTN